MSSAARWRFVRTRAFRIVLWWLLAIALVLVGALDDSDDDDDAEEVDSPPAMVEGAPGIVSAKPGEVYAGSAVIVRHHGFDPDSSIPVGAEVGGSPGKVLHASEDQLVVEIPSDQEPGPVAIAVVQGERISGTLTVRVKRLRLRKILRSLVGGMALFVFGLRTLARGLRGYAGQPMRAALARWTRGRLRGLAFGTVAGGVGQSMLSVAAFVVGLLESRLLTLGAALVVLLGAHVGAGTAILVLPLGVSRQALWIVAVGVAWLTLARTRRGESAGELVLGLGLLFYGLSVLRSGFQPLVGDPDVMPYLQALREDGASGLMMRVVAGTLLGALLQGPGAAFGLVLGIGESTALLDQRQCLEIVAATNLGASLATTLVALPFGRGAKRLGVGHVVLGLACTVLFLALISPASMASVALLGSDPTEVAYGKKILMPNFAPHLALSYVGAQVLSVVLLTPLTPLLARGVSKVMPKRRAVPSETLEAPGRGMEPLERCAGPLVRGLEHDLRMMVSTLALLRDGARVEAATGDEKIAAVRTELKDVVGALARDDDPGVPVAVAVCVAVLNLQRGLEQLQQIAERGIEKDYGIDADTVAGFVALHDLVWEGLESAIEHLRGTERLDIELARAREITMNAKEAELRQEQLRRLSEARGRENALLWRIEVIAAYEAVGNHVYRVAEVLAEGEEDDF